MNSQRIKSWSSFKCEFASNSTANIKKISWTFCQGCDTEKVQLIWVRLIHFVGQSVRFVAN